MRASIIDAHVHVWPSAEDFAYEDGKAPPVPGAANELIAAMDANGVRAAMIVQPINLGFDHTYVERVLETHANRFVGMCLANPSAGDAGVEALEKLLAGRFRGVRFNPGLWPNGKGMDGEIGRKMMRACAARTPPAVVGFMCFNGLDLHVDEIRALLKAEPTVPVLIDHFGFTKGVDDPNFELLKALGRDFSQVSVKVSAHFRVRVETSDGGDSTATQLRELVKVFGPHRLIWGSDYPFVTAEEGGYADAVRVLERQIGDDDPALLANIRGDNFLRLFPGALGEA